MELMVGTVISVILMLALFAFMDNATNSYQSRQNLAIAQQQTRSAMNQLSEQLQEAVSPDNGVTPPIVALTPTEIEFYADTSMSATELTPKPDEFLYEISGGNLVRQFATPTGASPPYTYSGFSSAETLVSNVTNSTTLPMFTAYGETGSALAASLASPATVGIARVHVSMAASYQTGTKANTLTLQTDVVPENPTESND